MTELEFEQYMEDRYGDLHRHMPVLYEHIKGIERIAKQMDEVLFDSANMAHRNMASQVNALGALKPSVADQMAPKCGCGMRECGICRGER